MSHYFNLFENKGLKINLITLFFSLAFSLFYYYFQLKFSAYAVLSTEIIKAFSLSVIVFFLPDIVSQYFKIRTCGMCTPFLIIILAAFGLFIKIPFVLLIIFATSIILFILYHNRRNLTANRYRIGKTLSLILILIAAVMFLIPTFFSVAYHSSLFLERIVSGEVHIDTLFHTSISHIFLKHHVISTGLHGTPYLHYHYGTHVIFAGLSNLVGVKPIVFYNIFYPIIFVPLIIKSFFVLSQKVIERHNAHLSTILHAVTIFAALFWLLPEELVKLRAHPYVSESFCVAITFSFFFLSDYINITEVVKNNKKLSLFLIISSVFMFTVVLFLKVSVGYIFLAIIFYLFFRIYSLKHYAVYFFLIAAGGILLWYFLQFIHSSGEPNNLTLKTLLFVQINNSTLIGIFVILFVIKEDLFNNFFGKIKKFIHNRQYLNVELFIVAVIASLLPIFIISTLRYPDRFYFRLYPFFLGIATVIPLISVYITKFFKKNKISQNTVTIAWLIFALFLFAYNLESSYNGYKRIPKAKIIHNSEATKYNKLLQTLNNTSYKDGTVFYVPSSNKVYWDEWATTYPLSVHFIIPSYTGMPQLFSIPYKSDLMGYSFAKYRNSIPEPKSFEEVKNEAANLGYKELIVIDEQLKLHSYNIK